MVLSCNQQLKDIWVTLTHWWKLASELELLSVGTTRCDDALWLNLPSNVTAYWKCPFLERLTLKQSVRNSRTIIHCEKKTIVISAFMFFMTCVLSMNPALSSRRCQTSRRFRMERSRMRVSSLSETVDIATDELLGDVAGAAGDVGDTAKELLESVEGTTKGWLENVEVATMKLLEDVGGTAS